eukprot:294920_1
MDKHGWRLLFVMSFSVVLLLLEAIKMPKMVIRRSTNCGKNWNVCDEKLKCITGDNLDEPDNGLLFGLECLIKLLCEMKREGVIKMRDEKEWNQFTQSISYAKKALLPFGNKEQFNELC